MRGPADRRRLEGEVQAELGVGRAQHGKRRRHDLRSNAVAFQYQDVDFSRGGHRLPYPVRRGPCVI
jgi:hypothetical protein